MTADIVRISQLAVPTVIGVYQWERDIEQTLLLDLELHCDVRAAAASDDLQLAVDYAALCQRVTDTVAAANAQLIERIAELTAQLILNEFAVQACRVTVCKPGAVATAQSVSVTVFRQGAAENNEA